MSEYDIETRLLGKEDIAFDTDGENTQTSYTDLSGETHPVTKLNASHIPLTAGARPAGQAPDVDGAIKNLSKRIDDIANQQSSAMTEDTTVDLDGIDDKQSVIDLQVKNLGGHTLTFMLTNAVVATAPISFSGFYNGTLIVYLDGGTVEDNGVLNAEGVLRFVNCKCAVKVANNDDPESETLGVIQFSSNRYGVALVHTPDCEFEKIAFVGTSESTDYAVFSFTSNACFADCTFTNTKKVLNDSINTYAIEEHDVSEEAHSGLFAGKAAVVHSHAIAVISGLQDALDGKASSVHSHAITDVTNLQATLSSKADAANVSSGFAEKGFTNYNVTDVQNTLSKLGLFNGFTPVSSGSINDRLDSSGYIFLPAGCGPSGEWVPLVLQWGYTPYFTAVPQGSSTDQIQPETVSIPVPIRECLHISFSIDGSSFADNEQMPVVISLVSFGDSESVGNKIDQFVCRARRVLTGYYNRQYRFHWMILGVCAESFESLPIERGE